jgi:hypothetical protein
MSKDRVYGHTRSGEPIANKDIETLAAEAEAGYDVDALLARRGKRGRPALGSAPASVESVRLDPELRDQLLERAKAEGTTTSDVIREARRRNARNGGLGWTATTRVLVEPDVLEEMRLGSCRR